MTEGIHPLLAHAVPLTNVVDIQPDVGPLWAHGDDDEVGAYMQRFHVWEPHLANLMRERLPRGGSFLDVGAYIGYFTVLASQIVGTQGRVIAVEPDPRNLSVLRANLWRHLSAHTTVLPIAAWSQVGHRGFTSALAHSSALWVNEDELVPCAGLDHLVTGPIDMIKVDAEGGDSFVLDGMKGLLEECPLAVVEFFPRNTMDGRTPATILEGYERLGRGLFRIGANGDLTGATRDEILALEDDFVELALVR